MQVHYFPHHPPPATHQMYSPPPHMYTMPPGPYAIPPATCLGPPAPQFYYQPVFFAQQYSAAAAGNGAPPYYNTVPPPPPSQLAACHPMTPPSPVSGIAFQFQTLNMSATNYDERNYYAISAQSQEYLRKLHLWLKTHRMHKYYERLTKYSFEQLMHLDADTLANEQFTQGAIKKLLNMIERVRMDRMAFECPSRSSGSPSSSGTCSEEEHSGAALRMATGGKLVQLQQSIPS